MKIKILDAIYCQALNKEDIFLIKPWLSYPEVFWKQGPYRKERKEYQKSLMGKDGIFLTGFIPKIINEAKKKNISIEWKGSMDYIEPTSNEPKLKGITFRPEDQLPLIRTALVEQRGVLQAPTGLGKTILSLGIMSCFEESNILFLCHEKTLMNQTYNEMIDKGFDKKEISRVGGGYHEDIKRITIAMMQTFKKYTAESAEFFDIVFIDEADLAMSPGGTYHKILTNLLAPVRFGLTATLPNEQSHRLVLEGLIGPVIGQLSIKTGVDLGLLAKPIIKIKKIPYSYAIRELRSYKDVYTKGIVENKVRNDIIVEETIKLMQEGKTVLVLIKIIEHGHILSEIFKEKGYNVPFVWGKTEGEERNVMKNALQQKNLKCLIASAVYTRGINIPSLGAVVVAALEKSDVQTLQKIGRGLRKTDDKDSVIILDFFDESHPYLIAHFGARISLYCEEGWL